MKDLLEILEKRKNLIIYNCLSKVREKVKSDEEYGELRELFLDSVNSLYREAVNIIAAQKGVVLQSFDILAKQMLPKNFSIEETVRETEQRIRKPREVKEIVGKKSEHSPE